jgi:hypothetical protein
LKKIPPKAKILLAMSIELDPKKFQQKIINNKIIRFYDTDLIEFLRSLTSCQSLEYVVLQNGFIGSLKVQFNRSISAREFEIVCQMLARLHHLRSVALDCSNARFPDSIGALKKIENGLYLKEPLMKYKDAMSKILSFSSDDLKNFASLGESVNFLEFRYLFLQKNDNIQSAVAGNPNACLFKEYVNLFTDDAQIVRTAAARNPNAPVCKEYIPLFTDKSQDVREEAAKNPNAVVFKEYMWLFETKFRSLYKIIEDPSSVHHRTFIELFTNTNIDVRKAVAGNPNAVLLKEYVSLFTDAEVDVLESIAGNPNAVLLKEYVALFVNENWCVRQRVAYNPNAHLFKDFAKLYDDEDYRVVICAYSNKPKI